jgi:hypothetical protein
MVTNIWTTWSSGSRSKITAGTVNGSPPNSVQGQEAMLTVDGAQDPLPLRNLESANPRILAGGLEPERFIARDDHRSGNGREIPGLAALFVVLNELVDLPADDLALIGLVVGRNAALEQVPVHLRRRRHALPASPADRLRPFSVTQHFETDELVDVACAEGSLVELHAELLHADRGDADHSG